MTHTLFLYLFRITCSFAELASNGIIIISCTFCCTIVSPQRPPSYGTSAPSSQASATTALAIRNTDAFHRRICTMSRLQYHAATNRTAAIVTVCRTTQATATNVLATTVKLATAVLLLITVATNLALNAVNAEASPAAAAAPSAVAAAASGKSVGSQNWPVTKCSMSEFTCTNGKCVQLNKFCDNTNDCGDGSDEPRFCTRKCWIACRVFSCIFFSRLFNDLPKAPKEIGLSNKTVHVIHLIFRTFSI